MTWYVNECIVNVDHCSQVFFQITIIVNSTCFLFNLEVWLCICIITGWQYKEVHTNMWPTSLSSCFYLFFWSFYLFSSSFFLLFLLFFQFYWLKITHWSFMAKHIVITHSGHTKMARKCKGFSSFFSLFSPFFRLVKLLPTLRIQLYIQRAEFFFSIECTCLYCHLVTIHGYA